MRIGFAIFAICMLIGNVYDFRALGERTDGRRSFLDWTFWLESDQFTEQGIQYKRLANRWYTASAAVAFVLFGFMWITD